MFLENEISAQKMPARFFFRGTATGYYAYKISPCVDLTSRRGGNGVMRRIKRDPISLYRATDFWVRPSDSSSSSDIVTVHFLLPLAVAVVVCAPVIVLGDVVVVKVLATVAAAVVVVRPIYLAVTNQKSPLSKAAPSRQCCHDHVSHPLHSTVKPVTMYSGRGDTFQRYKHWRRRF